MATTADITTIDYSGDQRVDSLLTLSPAWNYLLPARTTLYYTFDLGAIAGQAAGSVSGFNASQKAAVHAILAQAGSVTGVAFVEVQGASSADLHFASTDLAGSSTAGQTKSTASYSSTSGGVLTAYSAEAFVFLDNAEFAGANSAPAAGSAGFEVLLHEIGHALGLGHPFDEPYALPDPQDTTDNTVMSYTHASGSQTEFQEYDLLALLWVYGGDGLGGAYGYNSAYGPSLTLDPPPDTTPDDPPPADPPPADPPPAPPPPDDFAASKSTSGSVALGGDAVGNIESAGDRDWFAVSLQAGGRYVFELRGAAVGDGTLTDPAMRLLSGSGAALATNDNAGGTSNARIAYTATVGGTHYLEAASAQSAGTGTYEIAALRDTSNRAPVAVADAFVTAENKPVSGNLLANDIDPDGQTLAASLVSAPGHGTVALQTDGKFSYTPQSGFSGRDAFVYRASDGSLASPATVTVTVAPVNDAPVASDASIVTDEDQPASGNLPKATDPDGDTVGYAKASDPAHGTVVITSAGGYTYTPAADYFGADSFGFRVGDAAGAGNTYSVSVAVRAVTDEILGSAAADTLVDRSGDARLSGLAGGDRLRGGDGDDAIDGGPGRDTALYAGSAHTYVVARAGAGWRVSQPGGADGADTLVSVERLEFADKAFELVGPAPGGVPGYGALDGFLFDPVFYLLDNADLVPALNLAGAWQHYLASGAPQGKDPTSWFDAGYYEGRWPDLASLQLDDATLFRHFNLFGVWEGRSPGPKFDDFDGERYLADNPDVAAYVDAFVDDFLGSRSNGAIAHYILYGAAESRPAVDLVGQPVSLDYVVELGS